MLSWQHAEGRWHAADGYYGPNETFRAACGQFATATVEDFPILGGDRSGPLCEECREVWQHLHALPRAS